MFFCAEGAKIFFASYIPIAMSIVISICCFYENEDNVKLTRCVQKTTSPASRIPSCSKSNNEFRHIFSTAGLHVYFLIDCTIVRPTADVHVYAVSSIEALSRSGPWILYRI